jgi:hypothetical protein
MGRTTELFDSEHPYARLFHSREDASAKVRFSSAEHACGCLFGTGFTVKDIRCPPA